MLNSYLRNVVRHRHEAGDGPTRYVEELDESPDLALEDPEPVPPPELAFPPLEELSELFDELAEEELSPPPEELSPPPDDPLPLAASAAAFSRLRRLVP